METNDQNVPQSDNSFLKSLEEKTKDVTGLSFDDIQKKAEDLTGITAEELKSKAGDLMDKITSGELLEEGKTKLSNLVPDDAKDKIGHLAEEAKGIWDKFAGGEKTEEK